MAKHPILTEQLSKRVQGLFKRVSKRGGSSRRRRNGQADGPAAVRLNRTAQSAKPRAAQKPFKSKTAAAEKTLAAQRKGMAKPGRFWSDLFLVRPWLLVVGLWMTFVVMIAIALAGLSSPGRELSMEPVSSSIVGQPLSGPDVAAVSRLALRDDEIVLTQRDPAATLPATSEQTMPAWPLLVMVAACAGGCMMMSKPGLLTADSRRGRRRPASTPNPRVAAGPRVASSARPTRSRRKHRRLSSQRPAAQVMAFRSDQKIHHTSPRPQAKVTKPVSFAVDSGRSAVTVVPEAESSPLDWKDGSLAHRLDVRQSRSINSFL